MSDPGNQDASPTGKGKSLVAGVTTFAAVMAAFFLKDHYADLMKEISDAGYPLPVFIAGVAGFLTHLITWWTSQDLVGIIIGWIKNWKKIMNAWKSPN